MKLTRLQRGALRKVIQFLQSVGLIEFFVKEATLSLPLLLQEANKKINSWKESVTWQPGEIQTLHACIDYDRQLFLVYIFRINEDEQQENKKISVSRIFYKLDLSAYFNDMANVNEQKILSFVNEKIKLLTGKNETNGETQTSTETAKEKVHES